MRALVIVAALLAVSAAACAQSPAPAPSPDAVATRGMAAFKNNGCYGCHLIGKFGTPIGPDLSTVGRKYAPDYIARWLRDPATQRPNAHMPALELTEADVQALAVYLGSLR
jgi:mono/diheme cytochrome c family protein